MRYRREERSGEKGKVRERDCSNQYLLYLVFQKPFYPSTADIISIVACHNKDKS